MLPFEVPKLPTDPACERVSYCMETSPSRLPPQNGPWSLSWNPLSPFSSLSFALPHSEETSLPFWASGVLWQCSEVILWELLHIQMIFWCVCWGESGLPILFIHYLGITPLYCLLSAVFKEPASFTLLFSHIKLVATAGAWVLCTETLEWVFTRRSVNSWYGGSDKDSVNTDSFQRSGVR